MKAGRELYRRYLLVAVVVALIMVLIFLVMYQLNLFSVSIPEKFSWYLNLLLFGFAVLFAFLVYITISLKQSYLGLKYSNDYAVTRRRVAVVAHVKPIGGEMDGMSLSNIVGVRRWFVSKFKGSLAFEENAALSLDVYQGSSFDDEDFHYNLKKSLTNHSINDSHFIGFDAYNRENSVSVASSPLSEGKLNPGITLVFITETSTSFYNDCLEDGIDDLITNQDKRVVALSKLFETHGISRPEIYLEKYDF